MGALFGEDDSIRGAFAPKKKRSGNIDKSAALNKIQAEDQLESEILAQGSGPIQDLDLSKPKKRKALTADAPQQQQQQQRKPMTDKARAGALAAAGQVGNEISSVDATDTGSQVVGGALSGASIGAAFGPVGAGVGAVAGVGLGIMKASAAKKAQAAKEEAARVAALRRIIGEKGRAKQNAIANLGAGISRALGRQNVLRLT